MSLYFLCSGKDMALWNVCICNNRVQLLYYYNITAACLLINRAVFCSIVFQGMGASVPDFQCDLIIFFDSCVDVLTCTNMLVLLVYECLCYKEIDPIQYIITQKNDLRRKLARDPKLIITRELIIQPRPFSAVANSRCCCLLPGSFQCCIPPPAGCPW